MKAKTQEDGEDDARAEAQRAKKRAWDRSAQREHRKKTRNYIEGLEKKIALLEQQEGDGGLLSFIHENEAYRVENKQLRKRMNDAAVLLQIPPENEQSREPVQLTDCAGSVSNISPVHQSQPDEINIQQGIMATNNPAWFSEQNDAITKFVSDVSLHVACSPISTQGEQPGLVSTTCTFENTVNLRSPLCPFQVSTETISTQPDSPSLNPCVSDSMSANCAIWRMATTIFDTVSHSELCETPSLNTTLGADVLKAIDLGWDFLVSTGNVNPAVLILRRLDENVWRSMPKYQRAAIAYKSHFLTKYMLNPNDQNFQTMPEWERPRLTQRAVPHSVGIDFFPWPEVRDRLILNQERYFGDCDFFMAVQLHSRFSWPYRFEDAFLVETRTGIYHASPTFDEHVRTLGNWGMAPEFFDKFPEFRGDIPEIGDS